MGEDHLEFLKEDMVTRDYELLQSQRELDDLKAIYEDHVMTVDNCADVCDDAEDVMDRNIAACRQAAMCEEFREQQLQMQEKMQELIAENKQKDKISDDRAREDKKERDALILNLIMNQQQQQQRPAPQSR